MFQFELNPHSGKIRTEILVYQKGGVIKYVEAPANKPAAQAAGADTSR